jgi:hypothetical protein
MGRDTPVIMEAASLSKNTLGISMMLSSRGSEAGRVDAEGAVVS